jgi:peptidoglycan/LPS O-acetylase OafA/YrhL
MSAANASHNPENTDGVTLKHDQIRPQQHKISLDLLRALAILLVLGRHSFANGLWHWIGWSGVDLFFVLSGFLVSGLIFQEIKTQGDVRLGRFLVRRALKIYPSFYVFLLVSVLAAWMTDRNYETSQLLSEIFYLQSYFDGLWMHTWSLAVEEHFYLVFALVVAFWQRQGLPIHVGVTLKWLIGILLFWMAIRWGYCWSHRFEPSFDFTATHLRADGIWLGVILSFSYHFGSLQQWIDLRKGAFLLSIVIAVAMLLLFPAGSFVMNTMGILVVAFGYGGLLCLGLGMENRLGTIMRDGGWGAQVLRILASLGRHSYSIYLWHLLVDNLLMKAGMYATLGWEYGGTAAGLITIVFAILLGISMGTLIELPVLRWRNRVIT